MKYTIQKITSSPVVDYAAEELKKYLRMLMPDSGEIAISYNPDAKDGFRLGVMSDFGLDTSEAKDVALDDILHIDTDECGGIIAGSNPRSVLLAVYRYLTINGCRWLFPGIDGEFIPVRDVEPTKFHQMASMRIRGQCDEGCQSQQAVLDAIEWAPKLGMSSFSIEFENPLVYYHRYYNHTHNDTNRRPEPVSDETVLQWKRVCEAEIVKRGLMMGDMGHGWTSEPFGIRSIDGWAKQPDSVIPPESVKYLAHVEGKRGLFHGVAVSTQLCMSNPEARRIFRDAVVKYCEKNPHIPFPGVVLADGDRNHCDCENCRKKTVSDWYVILLNEIDEELTNRGLDNTIVYAAYADTMFPPEKEKFNNPKRFIQQFAPATRNYTSSVPTDVKDAPLWKFELNNSKRPETIEDCLRFSREWRKEAAPCPAFVFEYHFWWRQYHDPALMYMAKLIHEDVKGYHKNGYIGVIEDCSKRNFFPSAFAFYSYAQTLFDVNIDFEELKKDYFSTAYGEDWEKVAEYLQKITDTFDFAYLDGEKSSNPKVGMFYNPAKGIELREIENIVKEFAPFIEEHMNMPYRVQTVAYRILARHAEFCCGMAKAYALKAFGANAEAKEFYQNFHREFGKYEYELERYFDHGLMVYANDAIFIKYANVIPDGTV